ncbi:MAG TPA: site-specific integrase, partial [Candidatus Methylomirabilis sp.]|nr:site-specific integrase [Candidatus Methylomirabilis sp.]
EVGCKGGMSMARGSILWRCNECGTRSAEGEARPCKHKGARYAVKYPVQVWDAGQGRLIRKTKWEKVPPNDKGRPVKWKAEALLADRLKTVHDGSFREIQETTFADFADKWLKDYALGGVKRSTYQAYESHIRVHLKPAFGPLSLRALREDTIQGYLASKLVAGAKPKSVKNHLVILKEMLRYAVKWGFLTINPATEIKAPRVEREEMDFLTPEEVRHFLTATYQDKETGETKPAIRPGWYVPIKLAIFSGLRQGEQFALRVGDLDFHAGQVRVRRILTWDWKRAKQDAPRWSLTEPKTKTSVRNVDLPPDLLEDLRGYVAGLPDKDSDRLLFATSEGTPLDPKNVVNRVFKVALANAEMRQIRWHDLGHTYASLQLAAGANIKYLSQQMGHASVQITLDRYSHLMRDSHPAQAARLSSLVFDAPPATILQPGHPGTPRKTAENEVKPTANIAA